MEINNNQENIQASLSDTFTTDSANENTKTTSNGTNFEDSSASSEKTVEILNKNEKKIEDVSNLEEILTKFLENYESNKKKEEINENSSKIKLNEDFYELFPNRNLENELSNPDFKLFCSNKRDDATYGTCYKDFCSLIESIEKKAENRILSQIANKNASVGSISTAEPLSNDFFTKEQVLRMSSEQIKQNYNKIRESQQKW